MNIVYCYKICFCRFHSLRFLICQILYLNNTCISVYRCLDIDGHSFENKVNWLLSDYIRLERTVCRFETSPDVDAGKIFNNEFYCM